MFTRPRRAAALLALLAVGAAALAIPTLSAAGKNKVELTAKLKGNNEVPGPGDKNGKGDAVVLLKAKKKKVCFELEVSKLDPVTASHIHKGTADEAGDVKVLFFEDPSGVPGDGTYEGCTKDVKKKLIKKIAKKPDRYYVNVHTTEYPAGAIRGQLEPAA